MMVVVTPPASGWKQLDRQHVDGASDTSEEREIPRMNPYHFRLRLCYREYMLVLIVALPTSRCAVISGGGLG